MVINNPELDAEYTDVAILTRGSRALGQTPTPSTTASKVHSPTTGTVATHFSTTTFLHGPTIPSFDEIGSSNVSGRPEEIQPRVATLVAVMIAEDTDTEEGSQYSGVLIYDMKTSDNTPHLHPPLVGRIITDP